MPSLSQMQKRLLAACMYNGSVLHKGGAMQRPYYLRPVKPRPKTLVAPSKECSYCGGPVGQGFKQITVPKMAVIRMCPLCNLKMVNWAMDKIKEEENNAVEAVVSRS